MIFFDTIVKRVTNFSIQSYEKNKNDVMSFFNNSDLFQLSVLTSSRSLYEDIRKDKAEKIKLSLSKYFIRAHFNSTPFGVFNSVGVINWGSLTSIKKTKMLNLSVKYDNLFLSARLNDTANNEWLNKDYCINPSVHFLSETKLSFYKSEIQPLDKIETKYVEIDYDEDLEWLIGKFKNRININLILEEIISDGFARIDVEQYLQNVIQSGLIIDFSFFYPYAEKLTFLDPLYPSFLIEKKSHQIEHTNEIDSFSKNYIAEQNNFLKDDISQKHSHAINSLDNEKGLLDINLQKKIRKFIDFSVQYNSHSTLKNDTLHKFIGKISEKFNDGFIPINKIFNPYSGLNYTSMISTYDLSLDKEVLNKMLSSNDENIYLDLPVHPNNKKKANKLPATFSVLLEVLECKVSGNEVLYIKHLGGNSALNIVSRFSEITYDICDEVVNFEKEANHDKIIADINCIGTFRSLNISTIKQFYDYSIPINTSFKESSNPILLSDLFVHLREGKLSLISKKHKKEVLPKLTSAINPNLSDSEIYKFLCDFEFYNQEIYGIDFNFNSYSYFKPYIPRVYLEKDVLLFPSQILLVDDSYNLEKFAKYLKEKIEKHNFSKTINLSDSKGKLTLDTENENDVVLIFEKLKARKKIYISEYLYHFFDPKIVDDDTNNFSHELVVSIKNDSYFRESLVYDGFEIEESLNENDNIPILSDWLYLEIFCNSYSNNDVLKYIYENIITKNKMDQFFFINYKNPEKHLRIRFKTDLIKNKEYIIHEIHKLKKMHVISKYYILPYEQEIHRYGGIELMELAEIIFNLDSQDYIINVVNKELNDNDIKTIAILKIKNYLQTFNYSLDEMILHCENSINMFSKEFELTSELRKTFNKEYSDIKFEINKYEYGNFLSDDKLKEVINNKLEGDKYNKFNYLPLLLHMSMNRHFNENQRFNEFKVYYLTKNYLNQLKFTKSNR